MPKDFMRYDVMVQDAYRDLVRKALRRAAATGLPGEHHFYIAFRTDHPEVQVSDTLKSRYPQEMTIVLQHQFWGLEIHEDFFEVGLSFNRVPEQLHISFAAIKGFYDPSVQFGLEFVVDMPEVPASETPMLVPKLEPKTEPLAEEKLAEPGEVVSLDAFRKKS